MIDCNRLNLAKVECQTLCQQHLQQQQSLIPIVQRQAIASTTSTTSTGTTILPKVQLQALRQANGLQSTTVATGLVSVETGRPENNSNVIEVVLRIIQFYLSRPENNSNIIEVVLRIIKFSFKSS